MALDPRDFLSLDRQQIKGRAILALKDVVDGISTGALKGITIQSGDTQSIPNNAITPVDFGIGLPGDPANVTFDDLGFYIPANQTDAFEIPADVNRIMVWFGSGWANSSVGDRSVQVFRNLTSSIPGASGERWDAEASISQLFNLSSGIIPVSQGDLISFRVFQNTGGNLTLTPTAKASLLVVG